MNFNKTPKSRWVFLILLLAGIVVGGFLGDTLGGITYFKWLNYGKNFGLDTPLVLDLGILKFQFALLIRFTISGILGMIISVLVYKKVC